MSQPKHSKRLRGTPKGVDDMNLKRLLGIRNDLKEAKKINEKGIERLEQEKSERKQLNAHLEAMEIELDVLAGNYLSREGRRN